MITFHNDFEDIDVYKQLPRNSYQVPVDNIGKVLYHNFQSHTDIFPRGDEVYMTLWKWHSLLRKLCCGLSPGHGDRLSLAEYVFRHVCRYTAKTLAVAL